MGPVSEGMDVGCISFSLMSGGRFVRYPNKLGQEQRGGGLVVVPLLLRTSSSY